MKESMKKRKFATKKQIKKLKSQKTLLETSPVIPDFDLEALGTKNQSNKDQFERQQKIKKVQQ